MNADCSPLYKHDNLLRFFVSVFENQLLIRPLIRSTSGHTCGVLYRYAHVYVRRVCPRTQSVQNAVNRSCTRRSSWLIQFVETKFM